MFLIQANINEGFKVFQNINFFLLKSSKKSGLEFEIFVIEIINKTQINNNEHLDLMYFFFQFTFIINIFIIVSPKIITFQIPYYSIYPNIKFNYSFFNKTINLPLCTLDKYTILNPDGDFLLKCIHSFTEVNESLSDLSIPAQPCQTTLLHENSTMITNFKFLVFTKYQNDLGVHGYPLSLSESDNEYSFIRQLMTEHHLEKKVFSFETKKDDRNIFVHFGGFPQTQINKYKYKNKCSVKSDNWSCFLKHIRVGNKILEVNKNVDFDTAVDGFIDSKSFFDFMAFKIIDIKHSIYCGTISDEYYLKDSLYCSTEALSSIQNVIFEFEDGNYFIFKPEQMFYMSSKTMRSKFTYDFLYASPDHFVFGFSFLNQMNLSIFNYEEKAIYLYSDRLIMNDSPCRYKSLFIIVESILVIGSIFLFLITFYFKFTKK